MENYRNQLYRNQMNCSCNMQRIQNQCKNIIDATCVDELPLAMAYVPMQKIENLFDCQTALYHGTIFPQLVLPFEGCKGGRN